MALNDHGTPSIPRLQRQAGITGDGDGDANGNDYGKADNNVNEDTNPFTLPPPPSHHPVSQVSQVSRNPIFNGFAVQVSRGSR